MNMENITLLKQGKKIERRFSTEISMDRINALYDMAEGYVNTASSFFVPNGKFSDEELLLWEKIVRAFRTTLK